MTADDMELVREYAAHQSESAFATLVSRHASLVYSVALRQVRDPQLAEEITQGVFIILARKAGSLGGKTILPGWLYRAACYASRSALKREHRRQYREHEAYMQSAIDKAGMDETWEKMSPLLEEVMLRLGQTDRDALVLRFFEGRSLNEVGTALGASEDAAKKRVNRALKKVHKFFTKRGVISTSAVIAGAISAHSVQAVPMMLVNSVATAALAKGAAASASTLTIINGALKIMAWTKMKAAVVSGGVLLLVAGTATVVVRETHSRSGPMKFFTVLSSRGDTYRIGETRLPSGQLITAETITPYPGDWIWEPNSQTLERVPPLFLFLPSKLPPAAVPFEIIGSNRYLARGKTVRELLTTVYSQKDSQAKLSFLAPLPEGKFDCIVTLQTNWWAALEYYIDKRFNLVSQYETKGGSTVVVMKNAP